MLPVHKPHTERDAEGLKVKELARAEDLIAENKGLIRRKWREAFGR
jgi:hypothetical protein